MTSRLRELIQQLGEAIHESVIESEQIAGVVQDIRQHGFDVLLMLEATIGLNDVAAKEVNEAIEGSEQADRESVQTALSAQANLLKFGAPFTQNDLGFLRSLRISVASESENSTEPDGQ
ncbi:MAG TPA: hypothetical protein VGF01_11025 [Terracidiphilus sp.]|jgi:hypothetical protein